MTEPPPAAPASWGVAVAAVPDAVRYSLRTRSPAGLPTEVLTAAPYGDGHALCLGPDEWLLVLPKGSPAPDVGGVHASTDVSHRAVALSVTGAKASALIQCGCALDLAIAAFPVGKATRTVYEGVEIVLWRRGEDHFHVETWRSFAAYLQDALATAAADL